MNAHPQEEAISGSRGDTRAVLVKAALFARCIDLHAGALALTTPAVANERAGRVRLDAGEFCRHQRETSRRERLRKAYLHLRRHAMVVHRPTSSAREEAAFGRERKLLPGSLCK